MNSDLHRKSLQNYAKDYSSVDKICKQLEEEWNVKIEETMTKPPERTQTKNQKQIDECSMKMSEDYSSYVPTQKVIFF